MNWKKNKLSNQGKFLWNNRSFDKSSPPPKKGGIKKKMLRKSVFQSSVPFFHQLLTLWANPGNSTARNHWVLPVLIITRILWVLIDTTDLPNPPSCPPISSHSQVHSRRQCLELVFIFKIKFIVAFWWLSFTVVVFFFCCFFFSPRSRFCFDHISNMAVSGSQMCIWFFHGTAKALVFAVSTQEEEPTCNSCS